LHTRAYAMETTFQYIKSCQHKLKGWKKNLIIKVQNEKKNRDRKKLAMNNEMRVGKWCLL